MGRKGGRMTPIQVQMLVDILYENFEIACGKFSANFSREDRNNKWEAVATLLNSKGLGPQKTADQWRKSWADLKCAIRSKAAKLEFTGGTDLMNEKLTNLEKRVLQLAGDITIETSEEHDSKKLTGGFLLKKLEADLAKTEEDLMKAMKKPNQIALPYTVSKFFQGPEEKNITVPIVESIVAEEKIDDADKVCIEVKIDNPIEINNDDSPEVDDASYDDIIYDDSDINEETVDDSIKEPLSPPTKRRRVSSVEKTSITSPESKSFISVFQRQIETQTAVLKEQTSIMKDIAKSLRMIANSLHDS